ncbi:MAG: hypothetical protein IBJ09_02255 [Bacteroidia bacterium]|nr:hypothetical protein [Bacteroidia bacterium]
MQRREFLFYTWKKLLYPALLLVLLFLGVRFLAEAWMHNGAERLLLWLGLGFVLLTLTGLWFRKQLGKLGNALYTRIPAKMLPFLHAARRLLDVAALLGLGAVLYAGWEKDPWLVLFFVIYLLGRTWNTFLAEERKRPQTLQADEPGA